MKKKTEGMGGENRDLLPHTKRCLAPGAAKRARHLCSLHNSTALLVSVSLFFFFLLLLVFNCEEAGGGGWGGLELAASTRSPRNHEHTPRQMAI